jgi:hypothetical protein
MLRSVLENQHQHQEQPRLEDGYEQFHEQLSPDRFGQQGSYEFSDSRALDANDQVLFAKSKALHISLCVFWLI